jgi:CheY-like chemotaxis protein
VHRDGPRVVAEVKDDGVGMDESVRQHLFEPFFTTKGAAGAGLGLSVVYGIVQRHGGSIRVFSRVGVGSRFEVVLPLGEPRAATAPVANRPTVEVRRLRVMVVDDEPAVRDLLRDMVAALGHDVEAYESGVEAFKHYRPGSIDLLLTDLGMPGVSGWKLSSNIRAVDPDVTIVYVTGWGEDMNLDDVREAGADLVIAKPFTLEDVVGATQMAAQRGRSDRAA